MLLKDKVVIVSGIGPGLGVKLAVEAAREGARAVVAAARNSEKLDDAELGGVNIDMLLIEHTRQNLPTLLETASALV